jgi:hypothetical protein
MPASSIVSTLTPPTATTPSADTVLASLASAADAARQAYLNALDANPGADLSALYTKEMAVMNAWSAAAAKALGPSPDVAKAQAALDSATGVIRSELATIKNIATWATLLDNLVKLAASVAAFFV